MEKTNTSDMILIVNLLKEEAEYFKKDLDEINIKERIIYETLSQDRLKLANKIEQLINIRLETKK